MKVLSFGGGVQTTALAILATRREVEVDSVVFADLEAEKPETYWYLENYTKPLLEEAKIPFNLVAGQIQGRIKRTIIEHTYFYRVIPSVSRRWCSVQFKVRPIAATLGPDDVKLIGFSADELLRAQRAKHPASYPLIDLRLSSIDCQRIITDWGWPIPVKSSCFFCPFQRRGEWNWLKRRHPDLFQAALAMEARFYERRPDLREREGLFGGRPLWRFAEGIQAELPLSLGRSCWTGDCGR